MKHIEVVAGVIEHDGKILCMERDQGKYDYVSFKWEFPGGKLEPGETKEEALVREIKEELNTEIKINKFLITVNHEYNTFKVTIFDSSSVRVFSRVNLNSISCILSSFFPANERISSSNISLLKLLFFLSIKSFMCNTNIWFKNTYDSFSLLIYV